MTKAEVRRRVQPLVDKLGKHLVELVWRNVTAARDRAIDAATAQLTTELEAAWLSLSAPAQPSAGRSTATKHSARSASGAVTRSPIRAKRAAASDGSTAVSTSEPRKAVSCASTAEVATSRRPSCSKCGETGHNARTCPTAAVEPDESIANPPPISSGRRDRFAAIEAQAAARRVANGDERMDRR